MYGRLANFCPVAVARVPFVAEALPSSHQWCCWLMCHQPVCQSQLWRLSRPSCTFIAATGRHPQAPTLPSELSCDVGGLLSLSLYMTCNTHVYTPHTCGWYPQVQGGSFAFRKIFRKHIRAFLKLITRPRVLEMEGFPLQTHGDMLFESRTNLKACRTKCSQLGCLSGFQTGKT